MKIEDLPIDDRLKKALISQQIVELYPPQEESIKQGLLNGENQVVAIPTASGKTLIAILSIFSTLLKNPGSKAIYLGPLRALASEKFNDFKPLAEALGLRVAISTGDMDRNQWLASSDIIIATNEKFDSLIRHEVPWLNQISVIVSDEVHLMNDADRGPVLEIVLSLVRRNLPNCQIIALSATIKNAYEIAEWMDAKLILSEWRPVKLKEAVWMGGKLKYTDGSIKICGDPKDKYGYKSLALEMLKEDAQALVFANTRKSAVASAKQLISAISKELTSNEKSELLELANLIRSSGEKTNLRTQLADMVESGVAFHHAGLASPHRKIVEDAFRARKIKVLAATTTLSAGLNLPARRVIIRSVLRYSAIFGNSPIPVLEYKQMAGRAGRPRFDPYGEAIIIAKNEREQNQYFERYLHGDTEEIYSKLGTEPAMRAHILAFISSDYVNDFDSCLELMSTTFYGFQNEGNMYLIEDDIHKVLELLTDAKMITTEEPYYATPFGKRVSELYLDPLSARLIKLGMENTKTKKEIPTIVYLQLLSSTPDIRGYSVRQNEYNQLFDIAEKYQDQWINIDLENQSEFDYDFFMGSLKAATAVDMWLNEGSEDAIHEALGLSSGDLHGQVSRMEWLIHSALEISKIFKWGNHKKVLKNLLNRIKYGIKEELLPLVNIPGVGRVRARTLNRAGYKTIKEVEKASIAELAKLPGIGTNIASRIKNNLSGEISTEIETENISDSVKQTTISTFFE